MIVEGMDVRFQESGHDDAVVNRFPARVLIGGKIERSVRAVLDSQSRLKAQKQRSQMVGSSKGTSYCRTEIWEKGSH
jgi:hypothetical protein